MFKVKDMDSMHLLYVRPPMSGMNGWGEGIAMRFSIRVTILRSPVYTVSHGGELVAAAVLDGASQVDDRLKACYSTQVMFQQLDTDICLACCCGWRMIRGESLVPPPTRKAFGVSPKHPKSVTFGIA